MTEIIKGFSKIIVGAIVFTTIVGAASVAFAADLGETGWFDEVESYTPSTGWFDEVESYTPSTGWFDEVESYTPSTGWYDETESYTPSTGWYDVSESYKPSFGGYGGGYGSSYGGGYGGGYSFGGYSMVRPITIAPPQYPVPPVKPTPVTPPVYTGGSSYTNVTTVTNIDNSINDSFNTVVVAGATTPTPHYAPQPYCVINQALASGSGVTAAYLSWTSSNATSAYLSNVGTVLTNSSYTVWPTQTTTYVLTVYGQNGQSAQCQTTVYANNYVATPYVSLTQIPYTGFDFGTFGNAMYWAGLIVFAIGAAYLAIYYVPPLALAHMPKRAYQPVVAPIAPILVERKAEVAREVVHPVVASMRKTGTTDSMAIVQSKDGSMPKIVIVRN